MASPTMVRKLIFSASTVRHTTLGSKRPWCSTTFAPHRSHIIDTHCAAACIIGASA